MKKKTTFDIDGNIIEEIDGRSNGAVPEDDSPFSIEGETREKYFPKIRISLPDLSGFLPKMSMILGFVGTKLLAAGKAYLRTVPYGEYIIGVLAMVAIVLGVFFVF